MTDYKKDGYVIVKNLFSKKRVEIIKEKAKQFFDINSGIPDEFGPATFPGHYDYAIDNPHKYKQSTFFKELIGDKEIVKHLVELIGENVKGMQTLIFQKKPGQRGTSWHQEEYYVPTRDKSLTGFWLALENVNIQNGCMWFIPQSQRPGYFYAREEFLHLPNPEFHDNDTIKESIIKTLQPPVPIELEAGDAVFFNGYLIHCSYKNKSEDTRMALTIMYMSAESILTWDNNGKLKTRHPEDMRDIVMVAGNDPYAWKGTENIMPCWRRDINNPVVKEHLHNK